jgi:hypothetical protein
MGFMDETSSTGGPPILKWTKEAKYLKRGSDEPLNDQEFIADVRGARGGYLMFNGADQPPERHMGSIFPKDGAPLRSTLGNTDKTQWGKGRSAAVRQSFRSGVSGVSRIAGRRKKYR